MADAGELAALVAAQANDPALWYVAPNASEAYLQQALRALHAAVESSDLVAWARQVTDAIDGRPLPAHPDRVPAQVAYVRSVWAAALPLLAALDDYFVGERRSFERLREAHARFYRAYAADPLDPAPPPIFPWMVLAAFADTLRSTGWNDSGGPCWCLRAQEETGEPHRPQCARARLLLGVGASPWELSPEDMLE